ncbi:hypothetical protein L0F63_003447 [Massospora cicadina]|nr:hypothetical protein L0F63_003447 [Massospora cicadina]
MRHCLNGKTPTEHRTLPLAPKPALFSFSKSSTTTDLDLDDFQDESRLEPLRSASAPSSARDSLVGVSSFFNIKCEQDAVLALSLSLNGLYDAKDADSENNALKVANSSALGSQTFAPSEKGETKGLTSMLDQQFIHEEKVYLESSPSESESLISQPRPEKAGARKPTAFRRSCLNSKDLEPSLSSVLETLDTEGSSSQSSARNSLDLSTYASFVSSASIAHSINSEVLVDGENGTDNVVYKSSPESVVPDSEDQYGLRYRGRDGVNFTSSATNFFIPTRRKESPYESVRAVSEFGFSSSSSAPFPPPKSSLRAKTSSKKITTNGSTTVADKPKAITRKLSDPEAFAKAHPASPNLHSRATSHRSERTSEKSSRSQAASIPIRLQSLDHLKSHSADALTDVQFNKHKHIIEELIDTEGIYLDVAREREDLFTPRDLKLIFINIEEIICFAEGFLSALNSSTVEGGPPMVGKVFVDKHEELQKVYSQYFKMHEVSNSHLQELYTTHPAISRFLSECDAELKNHSKAWDLHSLLIKPIQRVLKYPLLIKELLSAANVGDFDRDNLAQACKLIQSTADYYNELKRRKDAIDRIIGPKSKKTELHIRAELNKKFFRGAFQLRKMAGIKAKTVDEEYNLLAKRFNAQEALLRQFWDEVQRWTLAVEDTYNLQHRQARGFLALYAPSRLEGANPCSYPLFSAEFSKIALTLSQEVVSFLNYEVYTVLYEKVNHLIRLFNTPALLMKKRDRKLQDYDILSSKESKGSLVESAQAYQLINQELISELPRFLALSREMFGILAMRFSWIQQEVYRRPAQQLARLLLAFEHPHHPEDNIVRIYNSRTLGDGVLDPFVKAARAIINSGGPSDASGARLARSISTDVVPRTELISPTNTISCTIDGNRVKDSRILQPSATVSYSHQAAPYPGPPSQLLSPDKGDLQDEAGPPLRGEAKEEQRNEHEKENEPSDNDSVSALDGSFVTSNDQDTRRDHLVDMETSTLGFTLMSIFDEPPKPPKKDPSERGFNSLRSNRTRPVANHLIHAKSSSTLEKTILNEIGKDYPADRDSICASDKDSGAFLSRQTSHASTTGTYGTLKLKGRFGSSESLKSNTTISSYRPSGMVSGVSLSARSSRKGGAPRHKPRPVLFECRAAFPYLAASETELELAPGMELRVFKCSSATSCPWWYGEDAATGARGWFPSSFCKRI